jgi:phosphoribosyl-ATP pyrophosphohydrolase
VKSFDALYAELAGKLATGDPGSGTVARVEAGVHEIGKKIVEEAAEVWMARGVPDPGRRCDRDQQLLYHLQVLMLALT